MQIFQFDKALRRWQRGLEQSRFAHEGNYLVQTFEVDLALLRQHVALRFEEEREGLLRDVGGRIACFDDGFYHCFTVCRITDEFERGAETAVPHLRAVRDTHGRIIVVMTHNTDVSDSWEREGEDPEFFYQFSPKGYALGINVLLYAMTH